MPIGLAISAYWFYSEKWAVSKHGNLRQLVIETDGQGNARCSCFFVTVLLHLSYLDGEGIDPYRKGWWRR